MPASPLPTLLQTAARTAKTAARDAASFIQSQAGHVHAEDIRDKGINDFASYVDEGAQKIILDAIHSTFPEHEILAEEGFEEQGIPLHDIPGWLWIVDPLDGTTNFMHGVPHYGVSIGLQLDGQPVMGLVQDVNRNETFHAIAGQGAYMNDRPCQVSNRYHLADCLITTGFPYKQFKYMDGYTEAIRRFWTDSRGVRRPGSASLDLAWVACGRFDGFFEQGIEAWDVAAGLLIVEEAGGRFSDFSDRTASDLDHMPLGSEIVASNGLIHGEMIERLGSMKHPDRA
ncbi:MAG: inositol monophosphatase family protein [Rhodothermales bacterium]